MGWRVRNWTKRMVWRLACWLARTQGINLNRAIYVGDSSAVLTWDQKMFIGNRIHGAAIGMKVCDGAVQTVFDAGNLHDKA